MKGIAEATASAFSFPNVKLCTFFPEQIAIFVA